MNEEELKELEELQENGKWYDIEFVVPVNVKAKVLAHSEEDAKNFMEENYHSEIEINDYFGKNERVVNCQSEVNDVATFTKCEKIN